MKTTESRKTGKPLLIELSSGYAGLPILCSIGRGNEPQADYWMDLLTVDFGVGFRFRKIWDGRDFAEGHYDVNLDIDGHATCECLGYLRHGHCRHIAAALLAVEKGLAKKSPRPEHAEEIPARVVRETCGACDRPYAECSCFV